MGPDGDGDYERIRLLVRRARGVDLGYYRRAYVRRRILARMRTRRAAGPADYARLLAVEPEEIGRLLAALSTKVTSFFRNPGLFAYLDHHVFPEIFAAFPARTIRLWSAACATGEEAWSLAALVAASLPSSGMGRCRVLGTDIDRGAIASARRGEYPASSLRTVPAEWQRRWFVSRPGTGTVQVAAALSAITRFRVENLVDPPPAGAFDLILCRNVLIYFEAPLQQRILRHLARGLRPGGYLAVGRVERVSGPARDLFEAVSMKERVYRRL